MEMLFEILTPKSGLDVFVRTASLVVLLALGYFTFLHEGVKLGVWRWRLEGRAQNLFLRYVDAMFKYLNKVEVSDKEQKLMEDVERAAYANGIMSFKEWQESAESVHGHRQSLAKFWGVLASRKNPITWKSDPALKNGLLRLAEKQLQG